MTTTIPTLDQVLDLAQKLPKAQRGELIARLAIALTTDIPPNMTPDEGRAAWAQLRESMRALPKERPTLAEQLETDRRERQAMIEGSASTDVDA